MSDRVLAALAEFRPNAAFAMAAGAANFVHVCEVVARVLTATQERMTVV